MKKKLFSRLQVLVFCTILVLGCLPQTVYGLSWEDFPFDENYTLVNITTEGVETLNTYATYRRAYSAFVQQTDQYSNLAILQEGVVLKAEYGVVAFHSSEACDTILEFKNDASNTSNYINGCYGVDGAYLDTNENGQVEFMISGATGWVDGTEVTIIPLELLNTTLTSYTVRNGRLIHQIKWSMDVDTYDAMIDLGTAPEYLVEGESYLSYDGHSFYTLDAIAAMLDDLKINSSNHALNAGNPYYNYYQYISHRSLSNYTYEEVQNYLENTLAMKGVIQTYLDLDSDSQNDNMSRSQYVGMETSFFQYQWQYGSNALMMLALSMNESAYGKSSLAFTRNNLFGHAAYDSDVEANASRYLSTDSSVYSHAKYYVSGSYCNPMKFQYHGGFFGNKSSGMSVSYASDPYWGEKAASNYMKLDEALGNKDYLAYSLGIKTSLEPVEVKLYPSTDSDTLYTVSEDPNFAFTLVGHLDNEEGGWYVVQVDPTLNGEGKIDTLYYYDFQNNVAYIPDTQVQVVLEGNQEQGDFVEVTFDGAGGFFSAEESSITYSLPQGQTPVVKTPVKEGFEFVGWDSTPEPATANVTYTAQYVPMTSLAMGTLPQQYFEYNDRIDIQGGTVIVTYEDGSSKEIPLTTSMIADFSLQQEGDQTVTVTYGGLQTSYPITVDMELDTIRTENKEAIEALVASIGEADSLTPDEIQTVLALKEKMDAYMVPQLPQSDFRAIDRYIRLAQQNNVNYVVADNDYDASISGLALSIPWEEKLLGFINNTYKVVLTDKADEEAVETITHLTEGYNYTFVESLSITAQKNLDNFTLHAPIQISIAKPEGSKDNEVFTVFRLDDQGEVWKCYTRQTDGSIQFMTMGFGNYVVTSKDSVNNYQGIPDVEENLTVANRDVDIPALISIGSMGAVIGLILLVLFVLWRKSVKAKR